MRQCTTKPEKWSDQSLLCAHVEIIRPLIDSHWEVKWLGWYQGFSVSHPWAHFIVMHPLCFLRITAPCKYFSHDHDSSRSISSQNLTGLISGLSGSSLVFVMHPLDCFYRIAAPWRHSMYETFLHGRISRFHRILLPTTLQSAETSNAKECWWGQQNNDL